MTKELAAAALFLALLAPGGAAWAAPKGSPWGADYFPNVPLVTHNGQTVRFYDDLMKGKKVLINFIFTSCEQSCPGWLFLSGKREDIDKVRDKLGDRGDKEEHANTVRVGDVDKTRWIKLPLAADPNYMMVEIRSTLEPGWSAGKELKSIAEAPRPEVFGPGQLLFHNRCAACHTFGKGDNLGPDLQGLTARRERNWIVRYLAEPEKMRAARDPIALELAKNHKVLMPNLSLTNKELGELIEYLEAKSVPPTKPVAAQAAAVAPVAADGTTTADSHHEHHHHHDHAGEAR
ncbi:MAG: hypothetical protein H6R11_2046 [Proteobacteria bacterium]|nr:hypothetical protein [Pseudomonadota bacterium]